MSTAATNLPSVQEVQQHRRLLGQSDLLITSVGFGAWAIGGAQWEFAWGPQNDQESIAAIRRAVSLGVNWIDTAAVYGLGHSETVVGHALREIPLSDRPYVFTKCSLVWDENRVLSHNLTADSIRGECEQSLRRLAVEAIDLYQIHWAGWRGRPENLSPGSVEEAVGALADLQRAGKIRHIGVSNFDVGQLERAAKLATIASLQPPYSMLRRGIEAELLPWCQAHNIGVIVYSPMLSGLLTGSMTRERAASLPADDWRRRNPEFQEPKLSRNLALIEELRAIGAPHHRSPGEVAIAWTLRLPAVTGAIVGSRSASQIEGVIGAATFRLSDAEIARIEQALGKVTAP
jgi:aryl-alcohol dehydrogenase-like predicted oxidoreductase